MSARCILAGDRIDVLALENADFTSADCAACHDHDGYCMDRGANTWQEAGRGGAD
jgi:hypothetical protein